MNYIMKYLKKCCIIFLKSLKEYLNFFMQKQYALSVNVTEKIKKKKEIIIQFVNLMMIYRLRIPRMFS